MFGAVLFTIQLLNRIHVSLSCLLHALHEVERGYHAAHCYECSWKLLIYEVVHEGPQNDDC